MRCHSPFTTKGTPFEIGTKAEAWAVAGVFVEIDILIKNNLLPVERPNLNVLKSNMIRIGEDRCLKIRKHLLKLPKLTRHYDSYKFYDFRLKNIAIKDLSRTIRGDIDGW